MKNRNTVTLHEDIWKIILELLKMSDRVQIADLIQMQLNGQKDK